MRYYVISDTHSFYTETVNALAAVGYFADTKPNKLIILGDFFDRGKESWAMQEFLLDQMAGDKVILIRGNHEDLFLELADKDNGIAYNQHVTNGTYHTALALTGMSKNEAYVNYLLAENMRKTPFYKKIIPSTVDYYETENYVFVHGWIPEIDDWRKANPYQWAEARWTNGMKAVKQTKEPKTIVCGHWNCSYGHSKRDNIPELGDGANFEPYYEKGIIAIDACTAYSRKVNCIVLEDNPL